MAIVMGGLVVSFAISGVGDLFRGFRLGFFGDQDQQYEIWIDQFHQIAHAPCSGSGGESVVRSPRTGAGLGVDQHLLGQLVADRAR